jgi:hypothetical protein
VKEFFASLYARFASSSKKATASFFFISNFLAKCAMIAVFDIGFPMDPPQNVVCEIPLLPGDEIGFVFAGKIAQWRQKSKE